MLTVEDYGRIRRASRGGMSIRAIARTFHHSRRKVRDALAAAEPQPYTRHKDPPAPKLGPHKSTIDAIREADKTAPRKQRHTAMQIFRRLHDEHGYTGAYDAVCRYVRKHRRRERETFIPLSHDPGERVEVDFGHIAVDLPTGRQRVPVLVMTWSYSNYPFAIALPTERVEAVLHGMVEGFVFFGCVPQQVWWDNPKSVVTKMGRSRERHAHHRYVALASHYVFEPMFCMAASPQEKPRVEGRVYDLQRRWTTPVPRVRDLDELNAHLRKCCEAERDRTVSGQSESMGDRFASDRRAAGKLPRHPFDPYVSRAGSADKYQTVAFDRNRYSVPRDVACDTVTVKGYVDRIKIVAAGRVVARHSRSYGKAEHVLDPEHYVSTLKRRPACLDHAPVFRDWPAHPVWSELRSRLESRHGRGPGVRHYVRILQLRLEHPEELVRSAVEGCLRSGQLDADLIAQRVSVLALSAAGDSPSDKPLDASRLPSVSVPIPNLDHFNELLTEEGVKDVDTEHGFAATLESQSPEAPHHAGRV